MDMWEVALKGHDKDTGKMSHGVLYSTVQKFIVLQVGVRMSHGDKHVEALPIQADSKKWSMCSLGRSGSSHSAFVVKIFCH